MSSNDAKRFKPPLKWQDVEFKFCKVLPFIVDTILKCYHYDEIPFNVFVESGAILSYKDARQERILRNASVPGDQCGIDGIVVHKPVNDVTLYGLQQGKLRSEAVDGTSLGTFTYAINEAKKTGKLGKSYLCAVPRVTELVERMGTSFDFDVIAMTEADLIFKETEMDAVKQSETAPATANIQDYEPRDYQSEAVDTIIRAFNSDDAATALLGLPPGVGKTYIMILALQRLFGIGVEYAIIACPTRSSSNQFHDRLREYFGDTVSLTLVSMDGTTDVVFEESDKPQIFVTTFDSMRDQVTKAIYDDMNRENTVVMFDEAHYPCVKGLADPVIEKDILVILASGTSSFIHKSLQCNSEYRSTMLLSQAEERGFVVPQDHYFPSQVDGQPFSALLEPTDKPELYAKFAASAFVVAGCRRPLLYCNTVVDAKIVRDRMEAELRDDLCYNAEFRLITAHTTNKQRREIYKWIAEGPQTEFRGIVSVHTIDDSLDIPRVDGVAIPGISSVATMIQRICRPNRLYNNKTSCAIAFFCTPEEVVTANPECYIARTHTIHCINGDLSKQDMTQDLTATTAARASADEIVTAFNNVSVMTWGWDDWIQLLGEFIAGFGLDMLVNRTPYGGRALGQFYHKQLARYRAGQLSDGEIQDMRDAGVVFETIPVKRKRRANISFEDKLRVTKQAKAAGVEIVRDKPFNGYQVGNWHNSWRSGKCKLTLAERASLDAIGFAWNVDDAKFNNQIQAFRSAKDANGKVKSGSKEYRFRDNVRATFNGNERGIKIDQRRYDLALEVGIITKEDKFPRPAV